jgi:23S rRNA (uracil1939-C5)-methyltransferase
LTSSETAPDPAPALRTGVELELAFTDLLANGQGVGRADGLVVFCFGPLPQERARVRIIEVKQRYAVADLLELLGASPDRTRPFCRVFGICGGCQLQHLRYTAQLEWKRRVVCDALERIGGFGAIDVAQTIGMAAPRAYRNKMSLVVEHRNSGAAIGFYKQRSHEIVPIDDCPIVTPKLGDDLNRLHSIDRAGPAAALFSDARHFVSRSAGASGQSVLTITTERRSEGARRAAPILMR